MKIFYITRTYPDINSGGGGLIRKGTIDYLRKNGYDVWIVSPNYGNNNVETDNERKHILLPENRNFKLCAFLETVGFWDDYMTGWANYAFKYLKQIVHKQDLLFATSGGELGSIILAKKLKEELGCKFIINLHDPISFTTVNGSVTRYIKTRLKHVVRDKAEWSYMSMADAIITSSNAYKNSLKKKYPTVSSRIYCHHFGYIEQYQISSKKVSEPIKIVYGGAMGTSQSPEILAEATKDIDNVKILYVGDWHSNPYLIKYKESERVELLDPMPNKEYINFLLNNADVGFVPLHGQLAELCIPSKLYEFINLGIPILGILGGDGKDIIVTNNYGIVADYDIISLRKAIIKITNQDNLLAYKSNVIRDREMWSMEYQIKDVLDVINEL